MFVLFLNLIWGFCLIGVLSVKDRQVPKNEFTSTPHKRQRNYLRYKVRAMLPGQFI